MHYKIQMSRGLFNALNVLLESLQAKEISRMADMSVDNVDADDFPETFNIVPTLQEAKDVLEMEEIERELGF